MNVLTSKIETIAQNLMRTAAEKLLADGDLIPVHFILSDQGLASIPMVDKRLTPRVMHPIVCMIADKLGADAIFFVMEAWMIDERKKDPQKAVSEHKDKGEMIAVAVATRQGEKALLAPFTRPEKGVIEFKKARWSPSLIPLFEPFWRDHENSAKMH